MKKEKKIENLEQELVLSNEEKQLIEIQRRGMEALQEFKNSYNELVQRTGFAWVVDGNSTLNEPKLGITKVG